MSGLLKNRQLVFSIQNFIQHMSEIFFIYYTKYSCIPNGSKINTCVISLLNQSAFRTNCTNHVASETSYCTVSYILLFTDYKTVVLWVSATAQQAITFTTDQGWLNKIETRKVSYKENSNNEVVRCHLSQIFWVFRCIFF